MNTLARRIAALFLLVLALGMLLAALPAPRDALSGSAAVALLRRQLGQATQHETLPPAAMLALQSSPLLYSGTQTMQPEQAQMIQPLSPTLSPIPYSGPSALSFRPNGVPSQTVRVTNPGGFLAAGRVYVKNASGKTPDEETLSRPFAPPALQDGPQVLILHTHGSEAYSMPPGESYVSTGSYRTADAAYSVVRVGDEIASVLSSHGLSVLHDRTLYDDPLYDGAYSRSAEGIAAYLKKYPTLRYVLDIHRDAVEDAEGRQYKLIAQETPNAAQLSFVMGSSHEDWQKNLALAVTVGNAICEKHPTVMRPVTLRSSNYNQHLAPHSLLVEVGAAGNSLDEALYGAQIFADAFAAVIQAQEPTPAGPQNLR